MRDALARTLRDPSLGLAFWARDAGHWVDAAGAPVTLAGPASGRTVTVLERNGQPILVRSAEERAASPVSSSDQSGSVIARADSVYGRGEDRAAQKTRVLRVGVGGTDQPGETARSSRGTR